MYVGRWEGSMEVRVGEKREGVQRSTTKKKVNYGAMLVNTGSKIG
jgi:hypothetical protein